MWDIAFDDPVIAQVLPVLRQNLSLVSTRKRLEGGTQRVNTWDESVAVLVRGDDQLVLLTNNNCVVLVAFNSLRESCPSSSSAWPARIIWRFWAR